MADISNEIQKIGQAVYGEEVRGAIMDALEAMNTQAAAAQEWATGQDEPTAEPGETNNAAYYAAQAAASAEDAETAAASGLKALANEAPTFDATTAYTAGDYVLYNSDLYRFTADHAAGAWTGTDATAVKIGGEIGETRSAALTNSDVLTLTSPSILDFTAQNPGKCIRFSTGSVYTLTNTFSTTDYIYIKPFSKLQYKRLNYTATTVAGMAFYDKNKIYISGERCHTNMPSIGYPENLEEVAVPENAVFARFSILTDVATYGYFELKGNSYLASRFEESDEDLNTAIQTLNSAINDIKNTKSIRVIFEKGRYDATNSNRYYNSITETKKYMINSYPILLDGATHVVFPAVQLTDAERYNIYFRGSNGETVQESVLTCATDNNRVSIPNGAFYLDIMICYSGCYNIDIKIIGGGNNTGYQTKRIYANSNNPMVSYFSVDPGKGVYSSCCYMLPPNYSAQGEKVPLILWFDGNMGYRTMVSVFSDAKMPGLTYLRDEGYAVLQIYSWGSYFANKYARCGDDQPYPSPTCLKVLNTGIKHFSDRYNIDLDNVHIVCKSMGGLISLYYATHPVIDFKSISMFSPIIDMFGLRGRYSDARKAIFEDNNLQGDASDFADINTDGTTSTGIENYYFSDRCLPIWTANKGATARLNAAWTSLVGGTFAENLDKSVADSRAWYANHDATGIYNNTLYKKMSAVPVKIWGAQHDPDVQYQAMVQVVEQMLNSGGDAELKSVNSYDHSRFDVNTTDAQTVTTELGIVHENVPIGWVESISWIRAHSVKH